LDDRERERIQRMQKMKLEMGDKYRQDMRYKQLNQQEEIEKWKQQAPD
jgi:actin-related protein